MQVYEGTVIFFNDRKGYGFIKWQNENDIFCHFSDIIADGYKTLKAGQKVTFSIGKNNRDEDKAINITVV